VHPTYERLNQRGGLAERLYGMRKAAGLTGDRMAEDLGWPRSKISKIENGRQMPSAEDIRAWAAECGDREAAENMLDLLAGVQAVHRRWRTQLRRGHAAGQEDLDRRTRDAERIRSAQVLIMPGLIQTAGYARSIMMQIAPAYGTRDVEEAVAARMRRQEILYDADKTFEFVITEAALRMLVVPTQVMLGQLDRLLGMGLGNVTLGIIPMGVELDMAPVHGFLMLDAAAIVETYHEESEAGEEESEAYGRIFGRLMAEAVTGEEARRLITAAAASLRKP
jgi:transcriptional regulator with XRE-family HTH domain